MADTIAAGAATAVWETPTTTVKTHTVNVVAIVPVYYADLTQVRYADDMQVEYIG